ncbi:MAG: hypothetical protein SFY32_00310 [Bacteroidota bacterium]|nr:hypothetical protein [Bacteroidota bacterium]
MTELSIKYNSLDSNKQKEVIDFIDFLLVKEEKNKVKKSNLYKEKILSVSTWNEKDIQIILDNQKKVFEWKTQIW